MSFAASPLGAANQVLDLDDFVRAHAAEDEALCLFRALPGRAERLAAYLSANPGRRSGRTAGPKREGLRLLARTDPEATAVRASLARADAAYWCVVLRHRPFIRRCAFRFHAQLAMTSSLEDLERICEAGAYNAAVRYDPAENIRFTTYAIHWIRARVHRERDLPGGLFLGRKDTFDDTFYLERLDAPAHAGDDVRTPLDALEADTEDPAEQMARAATLSLLWSSVAQLPEEDRVLLGRRMAGTSLTQLGAEAGCTKEAIRQREAALIERLRRRMRAMDTHLFPPPPRTPASAKPAPLPSIPKRLRARVLRDLSRGVSIETIAKLTGLSVEDVHRVVANRTEPPLEGSSPAAPRQRGSRNKSAEPLDGHSAPK